jgi:hypothetical protein
MSDTESFGKVPSDFWVVIAVDENSDGWILQQSEDARRCDLFMNGNGTEDNCVNIDELKPMSVYRCGLKPWSYQNYDGDWDCGIDIVDPQLLWKLEGFVTQEPEACCDNERRNMNGGCDNCGDPCL